MAARARPAPSSKASAGGPPTARRRGGWLVPSVIAAIVAVAGILALFLYPISQHADENFTIVQALEGSSAPVAVNETFSHTGTYSFGWSTADQMYVTFSVWGPGGSASGKQMYSQYSYLANGKISVTSGEVYTFEFIYTHKETVTVTGYVQWTAPAL